MVAEKSGDIDRGFSSVGLALRGVNPQLAEAADGLADVFAVGEGVLLTFKSLNPVVLGITVALGALTLGYAAYNMKAEEAKKRAEEMQKAIEDLSVAIADQQKIVAQSDQQFAGYIGSLNDSNNQLALLTGSMSEYELATAQATMQAEKHRAAISGTYDEQIKALKTSISDREKQMALLQEQLATEKKIYDANNKTSMSISSSAASEKAAQAEKYHALKKQIEPLQAALQIDKDKLNTTLNQTKLLNAQADQLEANLTQIADIKEQERKREESAKRRAEAEKRKQEQLAKELEIQRQLEEAQQKELQRVRDIEASIQAANEQLGQRQSHLDELQKIIDQNTLSEDALKQKSYEAELQRISELGQMTGDYSLSSQAILATELKQRKNAQEELKKIIDDNIISEDQKKAQAHQKELERIEALGKQSGDASLATMAIFAIEHEMKMQLLEEERQAKMAMFKEDLANGKMLVDQVSGLASVYSELADQRLQTIKVDVEEQKKKQEELAKMTDLEREAYDQKKKMAMRAFRFEQAASIAQVAFNTAEAITKALGYPPILRAAMIATIAATGAAQAAVISGRQPPSYHTGGMAPDETSARLLKGEAVLDRATVRAIGGEQGVKNLQNHKTQDNVVVIQPFKHFGRFAKEIGFQAPKKTGIKV